MVQAFTDASGGGPRVLAGDLAADAPAGTSPPGAQSLADFLATVEILSPLSRDEIERKFRGNVAYGGWNDAQADAFLKYAGSVFNGKVDLTPFRL